MPTRDRAIRLFTFLRQLSELRMKTIRTIEQYESVLWFSDIPKEQGCFCIAWEPELNESGEVWLEIHKPRLQPCPEIPEDLKLWLTKKIVNDSSREVPELPEQILIEENSEPDKNGHPTKRMVTRNLADFPKLKEIWKHYVEEKWLPWAKKDRVNQSIQKFYTNLYSLYQQQQRLSESYEVVLGLGFLTWESSTKQIVKRHLIVSQTAITFDAARGKITLGPSAEGARPTLEQDMLEPEERPEFKELRAIEELINEMGDSIWGNDRIHTVLKSWIHTIPNSNEYNDSIIRQQEVTGTPQVNFAPAIILRKRTERSLVRVFKEICDQLQDSNIPLPKGIIGIVKDPEDTRYTEDEDCKDIGLFTNDISEIFFPLPSNDEQREIAKQIEIKEGVLVQGPPGTGKSHTIANLVSHLLATGKRVLVTSHTPRALTVLRDKLPREIAPLCVIALGDDTKSMKGLEGSVQGITERHNYWNAAENLREIKQFEALVDKARREESRISNELRAIREAETFIHPIRFGTYGGTLKDIAFRLSNEEPRFSWISVSPNEDEEPPFTDSEALELLDLLRSFDEAKEFELSKKIIDPNLLVSPSDFLIMVQKETEALIRYNLAEKIRNRSEYASLVTSLPEQRQALISVLGQLQQAYKKLTLDIQPWVKQTALQVLAGRIETLTELLNVTQHYLDLIADKARCLSDLNTTGLGGREKNVVKIHALALLQHIENKGKLGFWKFRPKAVNDGLYLIQEVFVNGKVCDAIEPLRDLIEWIDISNAFETLDSYWSIHITPPSGAFVVKKAEYDSNCKLLSECLALYDYLKKVKEVVSQIPGLQEPAWHNFHELSRLEESAKAVTLEEELRGTKRIFETIGSNAREISINPLAHPVCKKIVTAIQQRDVDMYAEAYQWLLSLKELQKKLLRRKTMLSRLEASAKPLAEKLELLNANTDMENLLPDFCAAWNWARADRWLKRLSDPLEQQRLENNLDIQRQAIQEYIAKLAAAKAWRYCLMRLTEHESGHLRAWQLAVRRIGKGTGIHANQHRRAAREHMEECRTAIPAWIMPIYRVAETIKPKPDIFDVVIVDEASQSGPEALFLQYIANTIVVVGDHKQISPQFVGLDKQAVVLLRSRFISDIPFSDSIGIENSFFDQAFIRYKGQICLREHFRCMPEIIQFSNNLCYSEMPLIPLKQFGAGRLNPSVITVYVTDGYQKGRSPRITNPPEAEALVEKIFQLCNDKNFEGKTMGVISLLGEEQAKLIQELLTHRVGPVEMEKRHIHCGDAYAFQGDERDVMFLSMVSAPGEDHRIGTLTSGDAEKRFNVAASRAKEQMWLFHSVTLSDLNPMCLRYRLLEYCMNPKIEQTIVSGINTNQLRILFLSAKRSEDSPPHPFDSWFEVDVFLQIVEHGYRVVPQLEIAGYRIDLIVEGLHGRLAVECDGDRWHGPEQYEQDMARQRQLERSGYTFWRIRGSVYYRNPTAALESLWETLKQLRIYPSAQEYEKTTDSSMTNDYVNNTENNNTEENKDSSCENNNETDRLETNGIIFQDDTSKDVVSEDINTNTTLFPDEETYQISPFFIQYNNWKPRPLPDPRTVPLSAVTKGLVEIIEAEGPIICLRAYNIYKNAAGIQRMTRDVKSVFNKAIKRAILSQVIVENNEYGLNDQIHKVVRKKGCSPVVVRTRGDRTISEILPMEIAELMIKITELMPNTRNDSEALFRLVLKNYNLVRMTSTVRSVLEYALKLLKKSNLTRVK